MVDVGCELDQTAGLESPESQASRYLAVGFDVALVSWHSQHDIGLHAGPERAGTRGVDHRRHGACAVGGHDVEGMLLGILSHITSLFHSLAR